MGSSPVTATISAALEAFFRDEVSLDPGDGLIAAFSGGPDSTVLLWGLARLAERVPFRLVAAHLDHGMDAGSAERAAAAERLADRIGVPLVTARREVPRLRRSGESVEVAARRVRYEYLEEVRRDAGARWIATAHHLDDQAETVVLRLLFGSGLEGLGGIRPVQGAVVRPLLGMPRSSLLEAVAAAGLEAVQDPTNADLRTPRNRVRHCLLPALEGEGDLPAQLARLADRARAAAARIDRHLSERLSVEETEDGVAVGSGGLFRLPAELLPFALAWLHRRAGAPRPAPSAARAELLRQLRQGRGAGCDCGAGWRWEIGRGRLTLRRPTGSSTAGRQPAGFSYTQEVSSGH